MGEVEVCSCITTAEESNYFEAGAQGFLENNCIKDLEMGEVEVCSCITTAEESNYFEAGDGMSLQSFLLHQVLLHEIWRGARLPLRQIFRLQIVCKDWLQALGEVIKPSPRVCRRLALENEEEEHWFIMTRYDLVHGECRLKAFSDREGAIFGLHGLRMIRNNEEISKIVDGSSQDCYHLLELRSERGLMFGLVAVPDGRKFKNHKIVVINCFTGSLRVLRPPVNYSGKPLMRICFVNDDPYMSQYYIMLQNCGSFHFYLDAECKIRVVIYDSAKDIWKESSMNDKESVVTDSSMVLKSDFFFSLQLKYDQATDDIKSLPNGAGRKEDRHCFLMLGYNVAEDVWSKVYVKKWKEVYELENYDILVYHKYNGKLLACVAIVEVVESVLMFSEMYKEWKVCEMQSISNSSAVWVELSNFSFPQQPYRIQVMPIAFAEMNLICCSFRLFQKRFDESRKSRESRPPPVVYNISHNRWHSLLPSPELWLTLDHQDFDCTSVLLPWQALNQSSMPKHITVVNNEVSFNTQIDI